MFEILKSEFWEPQTSVVEPPLHTADGQSLFVATPPQHHHFTCVPGCKEESSS